MKKLTIDRKRWARGGSGGMAMLLNKSGNMCCLGFLGKSCGAADGQIKCLGMPSETRICTRGEWLSSPVYWSNLGNVGWPAGLFSHNERLSDLEDHIQDINDDTRMKDNEREAALKPLFLKIGYKLEFVG